MWTGLSSRTNGKDSTAEHSKTGATEMKTVEALLVCKLSESPFRILSVGLSCYFPFIQRLTGYIMLGVCLFISLVRNENHYWYGSDSNISFQFNTEYTRT